MNGLFSGLAKLGLGKLEDVEVYDKSDKTEDSDLEVKKAKEKVVVNIGEKDIIFDKKYRCVVCDKEFKNKTVMAGKAKLVSLDTDLRPKYQDVDCIKYDTVVCNYCGYGALTRFYGNLSSLQLRLVKENICASYVPVEFGEETYSYDDAIIRYQLCLANSVVKRAKTSERAYACLKLAWLYRGKAESLDEALPDYAEQILELQGEEQKYTQSAYEGFTEAMGKELFPICGMDEMTYTYVLADLARRCRDYKTSVQLVSRILVSKTATSKVKERARELRDMIKDEVKEQLKG